MLQSPQTGLNESAVRSPDADRIRVLVVDDSVVMRQLITRMLGSDPMVDIIGTARDGREAVAKVERLKPDVITLDVEMPELDGIGALRLMKAAGLSTRVIMCSSRTERGAAVTVDALLAGADDYVTKRHSGELNESAYEALRSDLLGKIKQLFKPKTAACPTYTSHKPEPTSTSGRTVVPTLLPVSATTNTPKQRPVGVIRGGKPRVLAIGVSTGGPSALAEMLPAIPSDFPLPIVIVQHMPPVFTGFLAERLRKCSRLDVVEAKEGMTLAGGRVLLAPGDYHMRLVAEGQSVLATLNQEARENSCRPAVDVLFRSVADVYGGAALAVVLTGMGQDGLLGVHQLKRLGASVLVQDQKTSVVWGMPGAVAGAQLADAILPLREIVPAVMRLI